MQNYTALLVYTLLCNLFTSSYLFLGLFDCNSSLNKASAQEVWAHGRFVSAFSSNELSWCVRNALVDNRVVEG